VSLAGVDPIDPIEPSDVDLDQETNRRGSFITVSLWQVSEPKVAGHRVRFDLRSPQVGLREPISGLVTRRRYAARPANSCSIPACLAKISLARDTTESPNQHQHFQKFLD
jgi:hypothetical protein